MVKYTIVYIGAKWCSICKIIAPSVEVLADCYNLEMRMLDYDNDLTDEDQSSITKVPTIRIIDDTNTVVLELNTNHINNLKEWLKDNVKVL